MTPFEQFRLWARRSPVGERVAASVAAVIVVALLGWVLVPDPDDGDAVEATTGVAAVATTAPGMAAANAPDAAAAGDGASPTGSGTPTATGTSATGSASPAATPTGTATATASSGCTSPPGGDKGVSDNQLKIAISITNIVGPAGNSTFGVPSVEEQTLDYKQVIDDMNAHGGVACRKLAAQFFTVNPADPSDQQQKCLSITQSEPFFVIDAGGYYNSPAANCFPQQKVPFFGTGRLANAQRDQFYPYVFGTGSLELMYRNAVKGLAQIGWFNPENGFQKVGYIYRNCWPDLAKSFIGWLQEVGLKPDQIITYDVGCPTGFTNPSELQQAILKFRGAGVTHVTSSHFGADFPNFTKIAQQQGFRPRYGLGDDGIIPTTYGNLSPDHANIAGAITIGIDRYGDEHTPGTVPDEATKRCNAIFQAKRRPVVYEQPVGFGGVACNQLWFMAAAVNHAPSLQRTALADGLRAAKSVPLSYPYGPNDFSAPRTTFGAQFWRVVTFLAECGCWRVTDPVFKPSFP